MLQAQLKSQEQVSYQIDPSDDRTYNYFLGDRLIAKIQYDDDNFVTQPWVVIVNGQEIHRDTTISRAQNYITWHSNQGTLPVQEEQAPERLQEVETGQVEVETIAPAPPTKKAKELVVGDRIIHNDERWEIESISSNRTYYQNWHSEVSGVRFNLKLKPLNGTWQEAFWDAASCEEIYREVRSPKTINPLAEAEFEMVYDLEQEVLALATVADPLQEQLKQLIEENTRLNQELDRCYINTNFGCYTRVAGEKKGDEYLQQERRRVASGELIMICCDVGGMGELNSKIGETAVNNAIKSCLNDVRNWRGVKFLSQLNSGDEFVFLIDKVDVGIIFRMDELFKKAGFKGVYAAANGITNSYIESANEGMELVYQLKKFSKILTEAA